MVSSAAGHASRRRGHPDCPEELPDVITILLIILLILLLTGGGLGIRRRGR
jgi:hypothetical protein